jgi:hypothetical protein
MPFTSLNPIAMSAVPFIQTVTFCNGLKLLAMEPVTFCHELEFTP